MIAFGTAIATSLNSQLTNVFKLHSPTVSSLSFPKTFAQSSNFVSRLSTLKETLAGTPNGMNAANFIANTTASDPTNFWKARNSVVNHLGGALGAVAADYALRNALRQNRG